MSPTRILMLAGVSAVALAVASAGVLGMFDSQPVRSERVSLAMPPTLDMVAFDNEETEIDSSFGPAMPQAVQLAAGGSGNPLAEPPSANEEEEPPRPHAAPIPLVQGPAPLAAPVDDKPASSAPAPTPAPAPPPVMSDAQASVQGLRVGRSGDKTRVIIDLSGSTDFAYSVGKDGKSVSIVLPGAAWKAAAKGSTKAGGRITGYEYQAVDGGSKVILSANEPVEVIQVEPHPGNGQGYQLVIDLVDTQGAQVRRGGLAFWTTKETPGQVVEVTPPPAPEPAAPPAPKVADASAAKSEPLPTMADYKKARDWSGFYAGLQSGYDLSQAKESHSVRGSKTHNVSGPEGGVFLGWGKQYGALYWGVEMGGGYAGASAKQSVSNGKHELSKDWSYNGALRVGLPVLDDGLLYVKGGYQAAKYKLSSNRPGDTPASSINDSAWTHGPVAGVGFDYLVHDNWFVRTEASYAFYNALKYTDSAGGTGKISPNDINLRLGVAYKF